MNPSVNKENDALFDNILELLDSPDCETPEVILLIGRSGAGKSALVNTIHKVLTGKYVEIADHGRGNASTVTTTLNRYANCGVFSHRINDKHRKEKLEDKIAKLPHILDFAGLGDEYSWRIKEILELVVGGYIPPGTSILALTDIQNTYGIGWLRKVFKKQNKAWKVTKIVFVHGCIDEIPKNLLDCLNEIVNIHDEATLQRKYQCGIFVVISKYDLVKDSDDVDLPEENTERLIRLSQLEKVEQEIAEQFSFKGAIKSKSIRWASLTEDVGKCNLHIENIALKFLKRIIQPGVPKVKISAPVIGQRLRVEFLIFRLAHADVMPFLILIAILLAILAFVISLLTKDPK